MVWCHIASERRMDRKSAHGSLWLGTTSPLSDPRSGWGLWRGLHPTTSINGHSRSTDVATFPFAERLIGSIRRECLDHVVVYGERHLRHVLLSYMSYYNEMRTHRAARQSRQTFSYTKEITALLGVTACAWGQEGAPLSGQCQADDGCG